MPQLSTVLNLPPDVQDQIQSIAQQVGVDYLVALCLAQVVSGGQMLPPDAEGHQGIMWVTPQQGSEFGFDITTADGNIRTGLTYFRSLYKTFLDYPLSLAAYLTSAATVFQFNTIPPFGNVNSYVYNIAALAQRAGCYVLSTKNVINQTKPDASEGSTKTSALTQPQGDVIQPANLQAYNDPNLQVNDGQNLNAQPWFDTSLGLFTGNPQIRQQVQPVSFVIYLSQQTGQLLTNPDTGKPIELQLNCSMTQFELQMKHIFNRQPSRTGQHVTFWGQQPDLISGQCSTGVRMNAFGLTDYFSVSGAPDSLVAQVVRSFTGPTSDRFSIDNLANLSTTAFRVAAEDAFVEFLKMFQMNGNVWYHTPDYESYKVGQQQSQPSGWSPDTGISTMQKNARNNDVRSRGWVAMKFKNNVYLGYFKSLGWTQDAEKPFQWTFNFTFQVERTYSALYFPTSFSQFSDGQTVDRV